MRLFVRLWLGVGLLTFAGLAAAEDKTPREPVLGLPPAVAPNAAAESPQQSDSKPEEIEDLPDLATETTRATAAAPELIQRGDLLVVELSPLRPKDWGDLPAFPNTDDTVRAERAATPDTIHVRVGADGYARFPATDRRLPFAELEAGTLESMLSKHLELHGQPGRVVKVTKRPIPTSLVTVRGMVNKPGVYALPANATLADAIEAAGGLVEADGVLDPTPIQSSELTLPTTPIRSAKTKDSPNPSASPYYLPGSVEAKIASSLNYAAEKQAEQTLQAKGVPVLPQLEIVLHHPHLDLGPAAGGEGASEVVIPAKGWKTTRLCIDGVIAEIRAQREHSNPLPPAKPVEDLFKPL